MFGGHLDYSRLHDVQNVFVSVYVRLLLELD